MGIKYHVTLTDEERSELEKIVAVGKTAGYRIRHAQMLLLLDEIPENDEWTDKKIANIHKANENTIGALRKRFVEQGVEGALERKKREVPPSIKIDGEAEAKIVTLACSEPPEGYGRWSLRMLADKAVELGIFESISHTAIGNTLKKTKLNRGERKSGVFLKQHLSS
jgi:hypothetical protein